MKKSFGRIRCADCVNKKCPAVEGTICYVCREISPTSQVNYFRKDPKQKMIN